MMNPYYLISLSGAYDAQDFWKKNRVESSLEYFMEGMKENARETRSNKNERKCA